MSSGGFKLRATCSVALSALLAFAPGIAAAQQATTDAGTYRITNGGSGATATALTLPLGKAAIIDLPHDARDVLLSNPQVADAVVRTARRVYVIGRQLGQTNAFFFDAQGHQIANVEIRVEPDVAPLNDLLRRQTPNGHIVAEAVNGSIVLSGNAASASEADRAHQIAERFLGTGASAASSSGGSGASSSAASGSSGPRIINLIQVEGSEQVFVRVRIVEMSRSLVRQLGVNLNYQEMVNQLLPEDAFVNLATSNGFAINGAILGGLTAAGGRAENSLVPTGVTYPGNTLNPETPSVTGGVQGYDFDPTTGRTTWGPASIQSDRKTDASIQAFERAGLLRVLAEPNLTAVSGEAARFLAGGEFPVPTQSDQGQVSVEFKPFGVGLAFTPVVMSGGRISLKLSTEVSELTSDGAVSTGDTPIRNADGTTTVIRGITIPALQVRRAETTLEMSSGSSIVMAGLIQERTRHALEGVPGVMNTPVIGSLFRSRDFINNETELVVIVTPYIVRPTRPDQMHTPADGFVNASEAESLLSGRLNAMYRQPEEQGDRHRTLQGPHGHVIE